VLLGAVLLSTAAEAQELPTYASGLIGMTRSSARRAFERQGHELIESRGPVIYESGAGGMGVSTLSVSETGLVLYCEGDQIVGIASGRIWGRTLFSGVYPGLDPFTQVTQARAALGEPTVDRLSGSGGDGGGTWLIGSRLILYSVCLRC
jgi:hypothetical protein